MSNNTLLLLFYLINMLWVAAVLGVTTYVVFWMGYSGWWYLLAFLALSCAPDEVKVKKP